MNKIIAPIKARCVNMRFYPIEKNIIVDRLKYICKQEQLKCEKGSLDEIASIANGDMRKAINILQSLSMMSKKIDINQCYNSAGIPPPDITIELYKTLTNNTIDFKKSYMFLEKHFIEEGYMLNHIIQQMVNIIYTERDNIDDNMIIQYTTELAQLEYMVAQSIFNDMYMVGLVSVFKKTI
jgi:DNA polymerase III delta prime subunit